ncbi:hypothetical protein [Pseudonocardia sp.]|uniref:hypothetical protein n=1 Tax=Pseudonocardia sp. TaxID=60912 RepID=UPI00260F4B6F|nr:hypothetical protein [Pseudonocardia sp.]
MTVNGAAVLPPCEHEPAPGEPRRRALRAAIWLPGLAVALGAAVATAHGLYEVAVAARVPAGIAWLYPLITDGLALVAYAGTARLTDGGRRYAWAVVILAAGLSGLAQAAYLAADVPPGAGAAGFVAPAALRFGVGAWPAIAAAIVAHLLYLLIADHHPAETWTDGQRCSSGPVQPSPFNGAVHPAACVHHEPHRNGAVVRAPGVQPSHPAEAAPALPEAPVQRPEARALPSPARDRARAAAQRHADQHGALPTVTELEAAAEVSRGTAAHVLKHLREHPADLNDRAEPDATADEDTQR